MKTLLALAWMICALALGCSRVEIGRPSKAAIAVTFERLQDRPTDYVGKRVRISGVLRVEFEGTCLFRDRLGYLTRTRDRSLWAQVPLDPENLNGRWVTLEATFAPDSHGHLGGWRRGSLLDVTYLASGDPREEPK